jgi:glutamate racemase
MNNRNHPIAIFDSGVGGLSIYRKLKQELPNENFVYLADQKNAPYGGKSPSEIRKLTLNCLKFLLNPPSDYVLPARHASQGDAGGRTTYYVPKLMVIACNTATVSGIEHYRKAFPSVPIIGVVPVVKTAAKTTKNKKIAILSTVATASSKYQADLISKFCPNYQVINLFSPSSSPSNYVLPARQRFAAGDTGKRTTDYVLLNIGCPNLVSFIEKGITSGRKVEKELTEILKPVIEAGCDTLVLGCTHYPFLKKTINHLLISNFKFQISNFRILDSAGAVARHAKRILEHNHLLNTNSISSTDYKLQTTDSFLTTASPQNFAKVIQKLINLKTTPAQITL